MWSPRHPAMWCPGSSRSMRSWLAGRFRWDVSRAAFCAGRAAALPGAGRVHSICGCPVNVHATQQALCRPAQSLSCGAAAATWSCFCSSGALVGSCAGGDACVVRYKQWGRAGGDALVQIDISLRCSCPDGRFQRLNSGELSSTGHPDATAELDR
ncbi:hypothetical protein COO60DRAFT_323226 [Scenedesmus sp. NREL 46B-D3]|nr:hypothetical protein COO60DRAFT_323226 [Scenedesmus sp. NREL 46B-D3]